MPRHARRRRRGPVLLTVVAVVVVVAAVALVATLGLPGGGPDGTGRSADPDGPTAPTPSATASTTPPPAAAPADGACYPLTAAALGRANDATAAVDCSSRHTSQTFLVDRLADADLGTGGTVDPAVLAQRASARCRAALPDHLGVDARTLTTVRLRAAWFVPTETDLARGARWLRCDVVAQRDESSLARLPRRSAGMLADEDDRERWTTCASGSLADLQAGRGQRMCALPHDWRAVGTRRVGAAADPWPGDAAVQGRVLARCEDQVRTFADDATGEVTVGWLPPTRAQWQQEGLRYGLCWARTD